jgi:hypothetical protein
LVVSRSDCCSPSSAAFSARSTADTTSTFRGLHAHGGHAGGHHHGHPSPFNAGTIAAFLTWFGGAGYLLTRYSGFAALSIIAIASLVGLVGGALVFAFLAKFINPRLTVLAPEDFQMQGYRGEGDEHDSTRWNR